jgi:hypothetical protein
VRTAVKSKSRSSNSLLALHGQINQSCDAICVSSTNGVVALYALSQNQKIMQPAGLSCATGCIIMNTVLFYRKMHTDVCKVRFDAKVWEVETS